MALYQQGDVLLIPIDEIPAEAEKREDVLLAYGEITGHTHCIADPDTVETYVYQENLYLHVKTETAQWLQDACDPIDLPQGNYVFWPQDASV